MAFNTAFKIAVLNLLASYEPPHRALRALDLGGFASDVEISVRCQSFKDKSKALDHTPKISQSALRKLNIERLPEKRRYKAYLID